VRSFWPIYKRELFAFFVTPLAWVLITVFLLVQGMHFFLIVDHFASAGAEVSDRTPLQAVFGETVILYIVLFLLVPPMTMRLFAEERRSGTIESLMTAPVSSAAVVLAKFAAVLTTYVAMWAPTVLHLVILRRTGEIDWGVAASAYLGVFLVGAGYLSLGLLASALTKSQFLALVMTALVILGLFILGIGEFITREGTLMHDVCAHVSVWAHMNDFASGIVDSRRLVYYAVLVALPLFVTVAAVEAWRWGTTVTLRSRLRVSIDRAQASQLVAILAAVVVAVLVNVVAARRYTRWDWTKNKRYSLSSATVQTLRELPDPVQVWVLLGRADPLEQSVKQLLVAYQAETAKLDVHYVDPDQDVVALEDVKKRFKIETGRTEQGHVVADAIVVVARGDKRWFLTTSDMVQVSSGDDTRVKPREEQALTGAIRNVLGGERTKLCFTSGHGEMSPLDVGEQGAGLLKDVLEKDNYDVVAIDPGAPNAPEPFKGCAVVVVAGMRGAFTKDEAERLRTYLLAGGNLLLAASPIPGESTTGLVGAGLERALAPFGIALDDDLVVEQDADLAFPNSGGSRFVVTPKQHAITAGLVKGDSNREVPKIVVQFARSMRRVTEPDAAAPSELAATSPSSFGLTSIVGAADWKNGPEKRAGDLSGPLVVAMASERPKLSPSAPHGPRVVALGTASPLTSPTFREPLPVRGAAVLVESAISWLASKPQVLDVPERAAVAAGIRITDESRSEIRRYVLVFMPATVALLGIAVAFFRRAGEGKPKKGAAEKKRRPEGAKKKASKVER
jgi:ABC-type transport system involved in cytochrome c biogenesis permease component